MNELKTRAEEIRNGRYLLKLRLVGSLNDDSKDKPKKKSTEDLIELKEETKHSCTSDEYIVE